jgi:hypothetical protein
MTGTGRPSAKQTSMRTPQLAGATDTSNASPPVLPTVGYRPESVSAQLGQQLTTNVFGATKPRPRITSFNAPHQSGWRDKFLERLERLDKHLKDSATEPNVKEEKIEYTTSWMHQTTCPCKCNQQRVWPTSPNTRICHFAAKRGRGN